MRLLLGTMVITLWTAPINTLAEELRSPPPHASKSVQKKPTRTGGNLRANADTDGTEAPNRFDAETAIKSEYTLDGKPLEVDPD